MVRAREIAEQDALAALSEHMDPLVARLYYNARLSPISLLPDEILLMIFKALGDDPVAYFLLRRVSRRFKQVLLGREFHRFLYPMDRANPDGVGPDISVYWSDTNPDRVLAATGNHASNTKRQFHCSGCNLDHNWRLFSAAERERPWRFRECAGRQGYLSLCAHVKITWDAVSSRYYQLRHRAALLSFETVLAQCKHPSHETRCPDCRRVAADAGPVQRNWPTAYLCLQSPSGELDLRLSWQAETGPLPRLRAFPSRGFAPRTCLEYSGPASFPGGAAPTTATLTTTTTVTSAAAAAEVDAADAFFTTGRILNMPPRRSATPHATKATWPGTSTP
ncbi:unnamed protein product [Parascedosporium putredinis]|uniref:F-box domain-containing protein n=1 Tax=Parascedosporium putredinis TaxID=1442378 RepID=A0A9P1H919_9PEZI|nr:unnamed protein product [Parascedosporium putredinis]CAI8003032.1 unnamed protein product [Parascedosporium putredinis]